MTLAEFSKLYDVEIFNVAQAKYVYSEHLTQKAKLDLFHLSDYAVSTNSCGLFWLRKRKIEKPI